MKLFLSLLTVAVLLAAGFFGARLIRPVTEKSWDPTEVYAVWISGVEVAPTTPNGQPWNEDGTAPNLVATLSWRDTMLLETPEASHTLAVEVKDRGLIGSRWVGAVTIPCGALKPGENELVPQNSKCSITSLTLTVVPSSVLEKNGQIPADKHRVTQGITVMSPPPPDETGDFKNSTVGKGIQEGIKAFSGFLKKEVSGGTNP